MKTIVLFLSLLGSLRLASTSMVFAVDPSPSRGRVLILKNEHTLEGDVERVGDRYRVRRSGGETWVPSNEALGVAASLPDAYSFLRARANVDDADERLRLANWCRLHGLREQAMAELRAAEQLRPDDIHTKRLMQYLKQEASALAGPKPVAPKIEPRTSDSLPSVEVTTECLSLFATRVQPILMNTCASCHATGRGGKFRLTQVYDDSPGNRRTLEQNLAAVLAEINLGQPEASRLLTKAVSDHAHTGQAPIKDRKDPPYRTLEKWVKLTVESNPQLRDSQPASEKSVPSTASEKRPAAVESKTTWGADSRPPESVGVPTTPGPVPVSRTTPASPPSPPPATPADPYDPEPFNQQAHPETGKPAPGK
jgi:hypothetical protein